MTGSYRADVAIAGLGLAGSLLARWLTAAGRSVVVVEEGTPMSDPAGTHLRNLPWCRADSAFYHDLVRSQLRPVSQPPPDGIPVGQALASVPLSPAINQTQRAEASLRGARQTHIFGGMGTLWNCVAPRLQPDLERWPVVSDGEWDRLYRLAEEALWVGPYSAGYSRRQDLLLDALAPLAAEPAPVACRLPPGRPPAWTGPAEILAGPRRARLDVLAQHAVTRLAHRDGRVTAAEAIAVETGEAVTVTADAFVVAAGPLRTPALLWASGIPGEPGALGRYLNDHPLCYARVVIDGARRAGLAAGDRTDPDPFVIIPMNADRPFHSVLTCDAYGDQVLEGRIDERLIVSMYWYPIARPRRDNLVRFSAGRAGRDCYGPPWQPETTFEYALGDDDLAGLRAALADMREVAALIGVLAPAGTPRVLSAGSSMHIMGTTRLGPASDGESVTDSYGRVWDLENLYLAGTGLISCATATNPTLAACALAIRTAEQITACFGRTAPTAP
ncbi:MAG TPA: GMC oxidoreductase [Streptosporangiaceae bacterium]|nr:GMC oxidoreductase [Streptosporangiaceae bacterium]